MKLFACCLLNLFISTMSQKPPWVTIMQRNSFLLIVEVMTLEITSFMSGAKH